MTKDEIIRVVTEQRQFFNTGATRDYSVRHEALCQLKSAIKKFEVEIQRLAVDAARERAERLGRADRGDERTKQQRRHAHRTTHVGLPG